MWEVLFQAMCCPVPQVRRWRLSHRALSHTLLALLLLSLLGPQAWLPACTKHPPSARHGAATHHMSRLMLQELKAALDDAIAALARRPELAAALWERLAAAVVVQPVAGEAAAVPRYDLSYQLNEIEVGGSQVPVPLSLCLPRHASKPLHACSVSSVRCSNTCRQGLRTTARRWRLCACSTRCGAQVGCPGHVWPVPAVLMLGFCDCIMITC